MLRLIYIDQGVEPIWLEKGLFWLETNKMAEKKRQISTPVCAFSAIVGVSLKCVLTIIEHSYLE
jgi:hypothetical protein